VESGGGPTPGKVVQINTASGQETIVWQGQANTFAGPGAPLVVEPDGTLVAPGLQGKQSGLFRFHGSAPPQPVLLARLGSDALAVAGHGG
jgi:hypothetical protein